MAQPPNFALLWTDGDASHLPSAQEMAQDYKTADDYGLAEQALTNFTNAMMRKLNREVEKGE